MKTNILTLCFATIVLSQNLPAATFDDDVAFLKQHTEVVVLSDKAGRAKVAVAPAWQGHVMTSTAAGDSGASFGWINREFIASGKLVQHINVFGGEDRIWLGPEGGQFSIFFAKGAKFDLANWYTPAPIDTMPWKVASKSTDRVTVSAAFELTNYSGTQFDVKLQRQIKLLTRNAAWTGISTRVLPGKSIQYVNGLLPATPPDDLEIVGYESDNQLTNAGKKPWKKETGLLSIWILGMFNPSAQTTMVIPIKPGPDSELGTRVTSDYFGAVPPERLKVTDRAIYFSGDGTFRSKIGINPRRSKAVLGSYDAKNKVLTIVQFNQPQDVTDYVNSLWKIQDNPYGGDAENAYNDGPPAPGAKPLGPFYEMESSSEAAALDPGKSIGHVHRTIHVKGSEKSLDMVAREAFGVSLSEIEAGLK
jgi:hypothetical protein